MSNCLCTDKWQSLHQDSDITLAAGALPLRLSKLCK
jgi:hypothetical protein